MAGDALDLIAQGRAERATDRLPSSPLAGKGPVEPCLVCIKLAGRKVNSSICDMDEAADRGCLSCRIIRDTCTQLLPYSDGSRIWSMQPGVIIFGLVLDPVTFSTTKGKFGVLRRYILAIRSLIQMSGFASPDPSLMPTSDSEYEADGTDSETSFAAARRWL